MMQSMMAAPHGRNGRSMPSLLCNYGRDTCDIPWADAVLVWQRTFGVGSPWQRWCMWVPRWWAQQTSSSHAVKKLFEMVVSSSG